MLRCTERKGHGKEGLQLWTETKGRAGCLHGLLGRLAKQLQPHHTRCPPAPCPPASRPQVLGRILDELKGRKVYITFDMDGLDPSTAPAVGTQDPDGLTATQARQAGVGGSLLMQDVQRTMHAYAGWLGAAGFNDQPTGRMKRRACKPTCPVLTTAVDGEPPGHRAHLAPPHLRVQALQLMRAVGIQNEVVAADFMEYFPLLDDGHQTTVRCRGTGTAVVAATAVAGHVQPDTQQPVTVLPAKLAWRCLPAELRDGCMNAMRPFIAASLPLCLCCPGRASCWTA